MKEKRKQIKKLLAFTLAEVLITLSILGVVAAITVPSLINKNTEKQTVAKVKKEFSALSEAYELALVENGPTASWGMTSSNNSNLVFVKKIIPYLKVKNFCESGTDCATIPNYSKKSLDGTASGNIYSSSPVIELADGTIIMMSFGTLDCSFDGYACGGLTFDINGKQKPNQLGRDIFISRIAKDRFIMVGTPEEERTNNKRQTSKFWINRICNRNAKLDSNGEACLGWVIYKGNMDYLRKDISW